MALYYGGNKVCPTYTTPASIRNQDKTVTENGSYTADSGYTGLGTVTVNVSGGSGVGIPREVVGGVYQIPSSSFTFSLPSNATDLGHDSLSYAFFECSGLRAVDFSSLTSITGFGSLSRAFCLCGNLASVDVSNVERISTALEMTFFMCSSLTSITFNSLSDISSGGNTFEDTFGSCTSLVSLSFPSLNSNSFGYGSSHFRNMISGVTGCTVHFPSNLQAVIGSWSDVVSGFGGTNTTVLFDLPATT